MHTIQARLGNRLAKLLSVLAAASAVSLGATQAHASQAFFNYMLWNYEYRGDCSLCHSVPFGTAGTATKPFAQELISRGVEGSASGDTAKLVEALAGIKADGVDTDGDGVPDLDEIADGNPNDPAMLPGDYVPPLTPEYGCVGTIAGTRTSTDGIGAAAAALVALALVLKRRRTAR